MLPDEAFEVFLHAYPSGRRQRGFLVMQLFLAALEKVGLEQLIAAVAQHTRSEQWRNPVMIPLMKKWLEEERWIQEMPEVVEDLRRLTPFEMARRRGLK